MQHADSTSLESFNKRNKLRNSEYLLIGFATIIIYHKAFQIVIEIQLLLTVLFSGFKRKIYAFPNPDRLIGRDRDPDFSSFM